MHPWSHPLLLLSSSLLSSHLSRVSAAPADEQVTVVVTTVTASPTVPSAAPQFVSDQRFASAVLNSTNLYREQHGAPALAWNRTLARFAGDYLTAGGRVTDACEFEHSGGPYGENLALGCTDVTGCIEAWGDERERYDFGRAEFGKETGHFTQLVWRNTSDVGCGRRLCGERGWYLVCEYWPAGNVIGAFAEMVQRPVDGTTWGAGSVVGCPGAGSLAGVAILVGFVLAW